MALCDENDKLLGDLKQGPDGKMYHHVDGSQFGICEESYGATWSTFTTDGNIVIEVIESEPVTMYIDGEDYFSTFLDLLLEGKSPLIKLVHGELPKQGEENDRDISAGTQV